MEKGVAKKGAGREAQLGLSGIVKLYTEKLKIRSGPGKPIWGGKG